MYIENKYAVMQKILPDYLQLFLILDNYSMSKYMIYELDYTMTN